MKKLVAAALLAGTALTPAPAAAQDEPSLEQQVAALVAEVSRLNQRVAQLEAEQAQTEAQQAQSVVQQAEVAAQVAAMHEAVAASPVNVSSGSPVEISWAGAPEIEGEGGWSFKPRGRLNADTGFVSAPDSTGREDGWGSNIRRVRLGAEGTVPGGFGYKLEFEFAGNEAEVTDAILTYEDGPLTVNLGQHNNFQGLAELTSSRWSTFIERAAFTDAFGFRRRLGASVEIAPTDTVLLQAGVFSDNVGDLPGDRISVDGRAVFMPRTGETQLHFGGSLHYADLGDEGSVRYRQRPLVSFTDERFINTGTFNAENELGAGVEAGIIHGRFHAVAEGYWQSVERRDLIAQDPTFFGGYVEAGIYLTPGDSRGYRGGTFNRTRPANPIDEGGIGAWQFNLRYDHLDLSDEGIIGGTQNGYLASLIWVPTDYTRLTLNYGHLDYDDAVHAAAGGDRDYSVDVLGMRAQIDF